MKLLRKFLFNSAVRPEPVEGQPSVGCAKAKRCAPRLIVDPVYSRRACPSEGGAGRRHPVDVARMECSAIRGKHESRVPALRAFTRATTLMSAGEMAGS